MFLILRWNVVVWLLGVRSVPRGNTERYHCNVCKSIVRAKLGGGGGRFPNFL